MTLGEYIKEKRTAQKLSIRKLSEFADISHTEIKRIEDGVRKQTSPQVLRSLATALNVPYEELMAAAGYIDAPHAKEESFAPAGINGAEDLTEEEIKEVNSFIEYLKNKRNK